MKDTVLVVEYHRLLNKVIIHKTELIAQTTYNYKTLSNEKEFILPKRSEYKILDAGECISRIWTNHSEYYKLVVDKMYDHAIALLTTEMYDLFKLTDEESKSHLVTLTELRKSLMEDKKERIKDL